MDSFFESLVRIAEGLGATARVARMGRDDEGWSEHSHEHVEEEASRQYPAELQMLRVLDRVVEALLQHRSVPGIEALAVHVLTLRVNLWATLLVKRQNSAPAIAQGVQVVVSTASMLTKFNAGLVPGWPRALRHDAGAIWGLAKDEYQQGGWEGATAETLGFRWATFLGDGDQVKQPTGVVDQPMLGGSLLGDRPNSHEPPLHTHTSASWLDRNQVMQHFTLTGSYRLGRMLVRVLQGMSIRRSQSESSDCLSQPVASCAR